MQVWGDAAGELYDSLTTAANIVNGILAARGSSLALGQLGPIQEVAVVEHSPRARFSAIAVAADTNFRRRPPIEIVRTLFQVAFVAVTAALFIAWLASSH
jgi:ammonia channel protein AmtB